MVQISIKKVLKIVLAVLTLPASMYLFAAIITGIYTYKDTSQKADAIIVLGSKSYYQGSFNPCLEARVLHGVDLYKQGLAPKLIMSGGDDGPGGPNEALVMKEMAMKQDVKGEDILMERKSTSTYENLKFSKDIMQKEGIYSVIIVTERFHNYRADMVATELSIPHTISPTSSPCWNKWTYLSKYFLREPVALIYYKLTGKL